MMCLDHFVTFTFKSFYLNKTIRICEFDGWRITISVINDQEFGMMVVQKYRDEFGTHHFSLKVRWNGTSAY